MTATELGIGERHSRTLERVVPWLTPVVAAILLVAIYLIGNDPETNRSNLRLLTFGLMWIGLASSWNLIGGYTGYTDFGHTVFVGIGGYTVGILMARLGILYGLENPGEIAAAGYSFWQAIPLAFIVGAVLAGLVGWPTLRLKGPYFAIAMLGTYVAGREIVRNNPLDLTNGGQGLSFLAPFANPNDIFNIMLVLAGLIFFISLWIYRSQLGKMLQAIREDEVGADMRGINTTYVKIGIFMLAGGLTASIGGTKAWWDGYIDPDTIFPATYTIEIIMMTMLGGIGRPWGPVLGAVLFYYGRTVIWASAGNLQLLFTGVLLAGVVLFMRGGILGLLDPEDRGLAWFIREHILGQHRDEDQTDDDEGFSFQEVPVETKLPAHEVQESRIAEGRQHRVLLQGRGVVKNFGGLAAVNDVDFEIHEGEIVGLLGPNGSGKTTLFNCISGVLPLSAGDIFLEGERVTGYAPWRINRSGLSRTFQRLRIYDNLQTYDNMLLARKWKGVPVWLWMWIAPPPIRAKANELLAFLKIDHVRGNLARNLSGGQQRLLEIGMTLMSDPLVVLLDEATSGVNPALVDEIKADIRRLNRERSVTFFLIEHNMSFAMELCDRIYVLDYGELIASGSPEAIQNDPKVIEAYFGHEE